MDEKNNELSSAPKSSNTKNFTMIVMAAAAVLIFLYMIFSGGGGVKNDADGCNVNFQSAWGQSPSAVWVDLDSYGQAKAVATFDFEYPEGPVNGGSNEKFRAYSRQVFEVAYTDDEGNEKIRFSKAYTCNEFEIYEPDEGAFRSILRNDVDGTEVKEYGDGKTVSILFFAKGDYSYTVLMENNPLSPEEAEALVAKMN